MDRSIHFLNFIIELKFEKEHGVKRVSYLICLSILTCCSGSDAAPKEKLLDLACPRILPAEDDLPAGWEVLGGMPADKLQLRQIGITKGNASRLKKWLSESSDRSFPEEIVDEWKVFEHGSKAVTEYPEDHDENALMCTYAKTYKESFEIKQNVVLLIPLPVKKYVTCLLVKRDVDPMVEASCKVK